MAGDYVFVGAGSYTAHGAPVAQYQSIGGETGSVRYVAASYRKVTATQRIAIYRIKQGCLTYVATGTAVFIGAPVFDVSGIWTVFAIGEYYGVSCTCYHTIICP